MEELRVKGLSCANCTRELEEQIQKLEHGQSATLSYNSGKLMLDENVSIDQVGKILSSEGAYIVKPEKVQLNKEHKQDEDHSGHNHGSNDNNTHDHGHVHGQGGANIKLLLGISAVLFVAAIFLQSHVHQAITISIYLISMSISGYSTFLKGAKNLLKFKFNIDTLMTIALVGAIGIGEWKEATLVAILFGVNELLEGLGMEKARRSMEVLLQVAPKEATLIQDGKETVVPIASLQVGNVVMVRAGEKIPSDGSVVEGKSSVNEAAITGESLPIEKSPGESVFGGSINNEGVMKIKIDKAYKDSSLAKILHLVEEAQETKTPTELFINKFAKYYTPIIIAVAFLVILIPPLFLGGDWKTWLYQGLAVLIVGCPCALILSSPIAIVAGITLNARNGILIKGGVFLEQLGKIDTLAFDKTGTLTKGEPHVETVIEYDEGNFYTIAASIEKSSSHPLAKAVMKKIEEQGTKTIDPEEVETISGQGIVATIQGEKYWLGNEKSMNHITITAKVQQDIDQLKENGLTLVIVANSTHILGMFGISDEIREESKEVIAAIHRAGIRHTVMLTGDHQKTAEKVAKLVGVTDYFGNLLPEDKVEKIKMLSQKGKVAMIGDGINDAPALATAQLGIAMGKGTDSAIETADIVLMQDHLGKLPEAIAIAKKVNLIVKINLSLALGLKLIALLLTIPGLLTLWIAILSDMGATVIVTLLSLTILIKKK
ncbi:cadmium-translocating P-type ATPase [Paenibacillus psychroresistens]|uniref:Cd(2+)-exporting ATPase n=1 Tax=Paenibacillus psychroresistens TaxID=1778678 RepID=A0A6B8RJI6_9BACL|nr:cation-translocating P-type ATPase [Paenibacillus psychroresistens]QGQ96611.1 cadmium-translocating P-type ATPase [Paenibacillus psychroresistens]